MGKLITTTDEAVRIEFGTHPGNQPIEWDVIKSGRWNGFRAQYRRLTGPIQFNFSSSGNVHRYALLDIYREDGETHIDQVGKITGKDLRDKFIYCAPGGSIHGWSRVARAFSFILVDMDTALFDEAVDLPSMFVQADLLTRSLLLQFKSLLLDGASFTAGYAETLAKMLREETMRIGSKATAVEHSDRGLTSRQLKSILSHMEDRIDQDISIADMARHLDMSPFHFIRMFKKAAGQPPHRYLLARRIVKAKDLLRLPDLNISEVAERSGFGGVTQLERTFRRIVGTTPSSFRRQLLEA